MKEKRNQGPKGLRILDMVSDGGRGQSKYLPRCWRGELGMMGQRQDTTHAGKWKTQNLVWTVKSNVTTLAPQMGKELPVNCLLRGAQGDSGGCWLHFFLWHLHVQPVSDHIHGGQQIAGWEARGVSSHKPYTF